MWNRSFSLIDCGSESYENMDVSDSSPYVCGTSSSSSTTVPDFGWDFSMIPSAATVPQLEPKKQDIVHLCLFKLQTLAQQQRDTSLRKSVLISNTLRSLQTEMLLGQNYRNCYNGGQVPVMMASAGPQQGGGFGNSDPMDWSLQCTSNDDSGYCSTPMNDNDVDDDDEDEDAGEEEENGEDDDDEKREEEDELAEARIWSMSPECDSGGDAAAVGVEDATAAAAVASVHGGWFESAHALTSPRRKEAKVQ